MRVCLYSTVVKNSEVTDSNSSSVTSEKPHAGGRWSYLPVLQGSQAPVPGPVPAQLPASSAFCFKRGTTHSNTQKPCHFMSPGTCCLFVKGSSCLSASKHLFFPPDLAHASSVLQDPCPPSPHSPLCAITCLQTCFHPNHITRSPFLPPH